ncbi:ATP synthase F1 subunit delta [Bacillus sp. Leaf406]|nr:ATP synthase F1 subunit delta [Bacillus sp. Leaf406]
MHLIDQLKEKNIKVRDIPGWGAYLKKEWVTHFAGHLSDKEKQSIYLLDADGFGGYLWHLFSYKKKKCLEGEKAEVAFRVQRKHSCFIFFQDTEDALLLENASGFDVIDLSSEVGRDIYVVDKQFRWTFVLTHETDWLGPYYSRR